MNKPLLLLSTEGCHLCEVAVTQLQTLGIEYQLIDIVEDDQLVTAYGQHIPVVMVAGARQALFWPFEEQQIMQYIDVYGTDKN